MTFNDAHKFKEENKSYIGLYFKNKRGEVFKIKDIKIIFDDTSNKPESAYIAQMEREGEGTTTKPIYVTDFLLGILGGIYHLYRPEVVAAGSDTGRL